MITINFSIDPGYWRSIPEQTRKPEKILGEFIDNSIKSWQLYSHAKYKDYRRKKGIPSSPYAEQKCVKVEIRFFDCAEKRKRRIEVEDNAWGIKAEDLQRAFSLSSRPPQDEIGGISGEFGKGMKDSGMWLSKHWVVHTKVYGDPIERQVALDLEKLSSGEDGSVDESPKNLEDHYTKIILNDLHQRELFQPFKQDRIMSLLSEIYSDFIESKTLELSFSFIKLDREGNPLESTSRPIEPVGTKNIRIWPRTKNLGTKNEGKIEIPNPQIWYQWYKETLIEMPDYQENNDGVPTAMVRCWVQDAGTRKKAGILLYRDERVIKGAGNDEADRYKPKELYEAFSTRSYSQQFLCGRVDLINFKTTYTKDDIRFIENQESVLFQKIKEFLESNIDSTDEAEWHEKNLQSVDEFNYKPHAQSRSKIKTYTKVDEGSSLELDSIISGSSIKFYEIYPYNLIDLIENIRWEEKKNEQEDDGKLIGEQLENPTVAPTVVNPNPISPTVKSGDIPKKEFVVTHDGRIFHLMLDKVSSPEENSDEFDWIQVEDSIEEKRQGKDRHVIVKVLINTGNTFYRAYEEEYAEALDRIAYAYAIARVKTRTYMSETAYRDSVLDFFNTEFNALLTKVLATPPSQDKD